jgi:hypothetical protein
MKFVGAVMADQRAHYRLVRTAALLRPISSGEATGHGPGIKLTNLASPTLGDMIQRIQLAIERVQPDAESGYLCLCRPTSWAQQRENTQAPQGVASPSRNSPDGTAGPSGTTAQLAATLGIQTCRG